MGGGGDIPTPQAFIHSMTTTRSRLSTGASARTRCPRALLPPSQELGDAEEERLIRIAEETYPPAEAILDSRVAPGGKPYPKRSRLCGYGEIRRGSIALSVTMDPSATISAHSVIVEDIHAGRTGFECDAASSL